ncbi:MAG: hypothetical protein BWY96_01111 [Spirochaetes bacterium ADurb.BinA120]|nr:MAG: hypothetical protein BWY96_01111 [Spirochaetes bacterium ADurb.BinA120]
MDCKKLAWYALAGFTAFFWLVIAIDIIYWYFY